MIGGPFSYDDRVLAYIDILGWRKIIEGSVEGSLAEAERLTDIGRVLRELRTLSNYADVIRQHVDSQFALEVTLFSDTAVISCQPTITGIFSLLVHVRRFCLELMKAGIFTRGAIVRGDLHHRNGDIVGPALVQAHRLESTVANFPRILFADSVLPFLMPPIVPVAEQDQDTLRVFNMFLDVYPHGRDSNYARGLILEVQKRAQKNHDDNYADVGIRAKMGWLITFLAEQLRRLEET